jgi:hypothetical protein
MGWGGAWRQAAWLAPVSGRVSDWVRQSQGSELCLGLLGLPGWRESERGGKERGGQLGCGGPRWGEKSGPRGKFGPKVLGEIRKPFSFSNLFINFKLI